MRNILLVILVAFLITIVGCATADKILTEKEVMEKKAMEDKAMAEKDAMIKDEGMKKEGEVMEKKEDTMTKEGTFMAKGNILAGTTTPYIDYNKEDYDKALAEGKTVVLYFYASWCPICRVEQSSTFSAFNELQLPNVVGFRVNFKDSDTTDDEIELAKQFGVTYQHTKVIIKNGERVLKAPDGWDKERYISEITKYA